MVGMLIKINFTFKKFNFNSATTIYLSYSYPESPEMVGGVIYLNSTIQQAVSIG